MAIVRKTLKEVHAAALKADLRKLHVPSDEEIARQIADDPDTAPPVTIDMLIAPQNLRRRLDMTQEALPRRSAFLLRPCVIGNRAEIPLIRRSAHCWCLLRVTPKTRSQRWPRPARHEGMMAETAG